MVPETVWHAKPKTRARTCSLILSRECSLIPGLVSTEFCNMLFFFFFPCSSMMLSHFSLSMAQNSPWKDTTNFSEPFPFCWTYTASVFLSVELSHLRVYSLLKTLISRLLNALSQCVTPLILRSAIRRSCGCYSHFMDEKVKAEELNPLS